MSFFPAPDEAELDSARRHATTAFPELNECSAVSMMSVGAMNGEGPSTVVRGTTVTDLRIEVQVFGDGKCMRIM